jgi:ArsR family transcriptional regulator
MARQNSQPDALLGWMGSLSDPARLRLLRLLEENELGVLELCDILQMPQSTVSRHLKVLADHAWIENRRQGTNNLYRARTEGVSQEALKLWQLIRQQTEGWPALDQDSLRLRAALARRAGDAQAFFAGAAGEWDTIRDELYGDAFPAQAIAGLVPSHWTVADLGCGTGQLTGMLAENVRKVIAVDQSPQMLEAARKRFAGVGNVDLRVGDITRLPIEDGSCDAALCVLVLTYVKELPLALTEARRVLKPQGQLVVIDLLRHGRDDFRRLMGQAWPGFESDAFTDALVNAGFDRSRINVRPIAPEPGVKGPALFIGRAGC